MTYAEWLMEEDKKLRIERERIANTNLEKIEAIKQKLVFKDVDGMTIAYYFEYQNRHTIVFKTTLSFSEIPRFTEWAKTISADATMFYMKDKKNNG